MPVSNDPKKTDENNKVFIREKIVKPPMSKKEAALRTAAVCGLAVVFGLIAAVTFAVAEPAVEHILRPELEETEAPVMIPRDEPAETTQAAEEEITQEVQEKETEPVEKIVQEALENYMYTTEDVADMSASLRLLMIGKQQKSMVTVHSVQQETDWFDNPVEMTGLYAGALIAQTDTELLVMTPQPAVSQADAIKVTFADGSEVDGRVKQQDTLSGVAIVSVGMEDLEEETRKSIEPLVLGNSYQVHEGDILIAVGAPAGVVGSCTYGVVSYVQKSMQIVDHTVRVLYADMTMDSERGTFFLNMDGDLVGWSMAAPIYASNSLGMKPIMGISDYKGILEELSNGRGAAYIGISGQAVQDNMRDQGMPAGIYVTNVMTDSPAYDAGIQNGDIITGINRRETVSAMEYHNLMSTLDCGQLIYMTVERGSREGYKTLEFQVTVGAR